MPAKRSTKKGGMLRVIAKGGSLASDYVMANVNKKASVETYKDSPRIKTVHPYGNTNLYQTTGGGEPIPTNNKVFAKYLETKSTIPNKNTSTNKKDKNPKKDEGKPIPTNNKEFVESLEKTSTIPNQNTSTKNKNNNTKKGGGKKKSKKSKKVKKSKKSKKPKKTKKGCKQRGGGSDWISSQYSLSIGQNKDVDPSNFSKSKSPSKNVLLNPPNLGLAGSGN